MSTPTSTWGQSLDGRRLFIKWGMSDDVFRVLHDRDYDALAIDAGDWSDLSHLLLIKDKITRLNIGSETVDWSVISRLDKLEQLEIGGWFDTTLSFKNFKNLKYLKTYWNKGYSDDIYELPALEGLSIRGWKEADCRKLSGLRSLKYLELLECKRIQSLAGLGSLGSLEWASLYSLPSLENIDDIASSVNLQSFEVEGCKKIAAYDAIGKLSQLRELIIVSSSNIASLSMLNDLSNLEYLAFGNGVKVEDVDLSCLYRLQNLRVVRYTRSTDYGVKPEDIEEFLREKWGEYDKFKTFYKKPSFQV